MAVVAFRRCTCWFSRSYTTSSSPTFCTMRFFFRALGNIRPPCCPVAYSPVSPGLNAHRLHALQDLGSDRIRLAPPPLEAHCTRGHPLQHVKGELRRDLRKHRVLQ